jgi:hypothetical protein
MIRSMEGFTFASALDLNMGYYHIKLDTDIQKVCTIVFTWHMGKYKYKRLPMGIKIAWILMLFKTSCLRLSKLEMLLARISTAEMRVNISKSNFFAEQIEYLGYWITRQGIQAMRNKVEKNAILNIKAPKTRKEDRTTPVYWYRQLLSQHVVSQK